MQNSISNFIQLIKTQQIDNEFIGDYKDLGFNFIFGGHVLAQSINVAYTSVTQDRNLSSIHCYFLTAGDINKKLHYKIKNLKDGNIISAREIRVYQDDELIFNLTASFQKKIDGFMHQANARTQVKPNELRNLEDIMSDNKLSNIQKSNLSFLTDSPIEIRPIDFEKILNCKKQENTREFYFRLRDNSLEISKGIQDSILAYASDGFFLPTSIQKHARNMLSSDMKVASIDHAIWYHRSFDIKDWLLYEIESPNACNSRGLVSGRIYNLDGDLVASTMQEGLILKRHKNN